VPVTATCERCKEDVSDFGEAIVSLFIEGERMRSFCSRACERAWLVDRYETYRAALRRIYLDGRGKAADVARRALYGEGR
jgi:hypothetical protein